VIEALSFSLAYHVDESKHPTDFYKANFFSLVKDGRNFIHKMIKRAFEMAKFIADDNQYDDENIPYK
jgi:hypothetical protein